MLKRPIEYNCVFFFNLVRAFYFIIISVCNYTILDFYFFWSQVGSKLNFTEW